MAAGQGENEAGKLSEVLQYLVLYVYGLIKTPLLSPIQSIPMGDPMLDKIASLRFMVNNLSPEEVLPIYHPQVYNVSDPNLTDKEFPSVSKKCNFNSLFRSKC
jgi:hypothetical protein